MRQNLILEKLQKARLLPLFYNNDVNVSKNLIDAVCTKKRHATIWKKNYNY